MAQVAGDFYDFFAVDDSGLTILIADVSGHGVPAALIASMLKVAFAQQANNAGDPAAVLRGLNTILTGIPRGQFITAACACIDLKGQQITYSGAGHPPPILVRSGGDSLELLQNGLLLGPFRQASYANMAIPFQPGDCLMLYTDGIIEAAYVDGEPFGRERLRDFFASQRGFKPAAIADALMNTLSTRGQQDDLTVVIAHYT
jgi:serine phosphatase RsbU (regulator of sigma subunit)